MFTDNTCDTRRPFFLAVIPDHFHNFPFIRCVQEICGCHSLALVHTHIQRRVFVIAETAFCRIQLWTGYSQIQQGAVQRFCSCFFQKLPGVMKITADGSEARIILQSFRCGKDSVFIPVDSVQACRSAGGFQDCAASGFTFIHSSTSFSSTGSCLNSTAAPHPFCRTYSPARQLCTLYCPKGNPSLYTLRSSLKTLNSELLFMDSAPVRFSAHR